MNEVIQTILKRRSIRNYQDQQISDEYLEIILNAAQYAPSGSNNQLWRFTAIQNKEILQALNQAMRECLKQANFSENDYPAKLSSKKKAEIPSYSFFYQAPTLIIVSNERSYINAMADSAAALENIFLAATSLGLASCWINQLSWFSDEAPIRKILSEIKIPESHLVYGSAALGYAEGHIPQAAPRKEGRIEIFR